MWCLDIMLSCVEHQKSFITMWPVTVTWCFGIPDNGFYLYPEFSHPLPLPFPEEDTSESNQSQDYDSFILEEYLPVTLWNWWYVFKLH